MLRINILKPDSITSCTTYWPGVSHGRNLQDQAVFLHHRAVQIHPFPNGNGRWSRLLSNIWLKRNDELIVRWPEEVIGTVSMHRAEYIAAVRQADQGEYVPLQELHRRFLETS